MWNDDPRPVPHRELNLLKVLQFPQCPHMLLPHLETRPLVLTTTTIITRPLLPKDHLPEMPLLKNLNSILGILSRSMVVNDAGGSPSLPNVL